MSEAVVTQNGPPELDSDEEAERERMRPADIHAVSLNK